MENEHYEEVLNFDFLLTENAVKHFADLNIKLLSGRHVQPEDYYIFKLLDEQFIHLQLYYEKYYRLNLVKDSFDNTVYYYLDFFDNAKGKLSDPSRNRQLSSIQTVVGLALINMYYSKYFENPKQISWSEIRQEIEQGEFRSLYKTAFFGDDKKEIPDAEWSRINKNWRNAIGNFEDLGWVKRVSDPGEEFVIELSPAIHRLAKLYQAELANFSVFIDQLQITNEEE